jgi:hypothetical protein
VSLAREWVQDHAPCSMVDYITSVTPLMPTHIIRDGRRRASQSALAKQAIRFASIEVVGDRIVGLKGTGPRPCRYDHLDSFTRHASSDGIVDLANVAESEMPNRQRWAFSNWLQKNAKRISRGVYQLEAKWIEAAEHEQAK